MTPDIFQMVAHAELVTQLVILVLLGGGFYSWYVIFRTALALSQAKSFDANFEQKFLSGVDLNYLTNSSRTTAANRGPMEGIFASGMYEYQKLFVHGIKDPAIVIDGVISTMRARILREKASQELNLSFLDTLIWVGPSAGLFGALWECSSSMLAFDVGTESSRMFLIGLTLMPLSIGLFVSITARIAYQRFTRDISYTNLMQEAFSNELANRLRRHLSFRIAPNGTENPTTQTQTQILNDPEKSDYTFWSRLTRVNILNSFTRSQYISIVVINFITMYCIISLFIYLAD